MSLAVAFKGPEGIVLAADSRVTMMAQMNVAIPLAPPQGGGSAPVQLIPSYFDNAQKLLRIEGQPFIGIVTYGAGAIGAASPRTAHGYMPEFEAHLSGVCDAEQQERLTTLRVAQEVATFFHQQWTTEGMPPAPLPPGVQDMVFLVAGFDDGEAYGRVYEVHVPTALVPNEKTDFGITMGGQNDLVSRLMAGFDPKAVAVVKAHLGLDDQQAAALAQVLQQNLGLPIPYQFLPLQDCVDLSEFMVSMTTTVQTWMFGVRGVGGDVDVATITRTEGLQPIRQKKVRLWD
jgi:hypothetical protein